MFTTRPNGIATGAMLALAFAMLWVPLGQEAFLHAHWMKLGTFMAPFLMLVALALAPEDGLAWRDLRVLSLLMLIAYIAHQFEEHWVDLYGRPYAFHASINALIRETFAMPADAEVLSPAAIFVINTTLVWFLGAVAMWRAPAHAFPAMAFCGIVLVNAVVHIALALGGSYNPGLLTSVVLFLPLGIFVVVLSARAGVSGRLILAGIVYAIAAHAVMAGGILLSSVKGVLPESAYFGALVVSAAAPLVLFRPVSRSP